MTDITAGNLKAFRGKLAPSLPDARLTLYAAVLNSACTSNGIDSTLRIAHFIAQVAEETGCFRSLVESTNYTNEAQLDALFNNVQGVDHARRLIIAGSVAIGNTIYAHRLGNGDVASGDGYRFRGRGFLQITGRANYRRIGEMVGLPLETQPELLGEPGPAAKAAATFWKVRDINDAADANDSGAVTLLVNGPMRVGLKNREAWLARAKVIWPKVG